MLEKKILRNLIYLFGMSVQWDLLKAFFSFGDHLWILDVLSSDDLSISSTGSKLINIAKNFNYDNKIINIAHAINFSM